MISRTIKVVIAAVALLLMCGFANAQNGRWGDRDDNGRSGWQQNRRDQKEYQHGMRDGQNDRQHNRAYRPRHNEGDYAAGYRAGYGQGYIYQRGDRDDRDRDGDRDRDRDRDRGIYGQNGGYGYPNGRYPNGGYYPGYPRTYPGYPTGTYGRYPNGQYPGGVYGNQNIGQIAYQNGYQAGSYYGNDDRMHNKGYNPPQNFKTYQNATGGYNVTMGNRAYYQQAYRQGWVAGYNSAFRGGYGYRR